MKRDAFFSPLKTEISMKFQGNVAENKLETTIENYQFQFSIQLTRFPKHFASITIEISFFGKLSEN